MNGMQTLPTEEVLDLPTAKTLQQGIHKVSLHSLDFCEFNLSGSNLKTEQIAFYRDPHCSLMCKRNSFNVSRILFCYQIV